MIDNVERTFVTPQLEPGDWISFSYKGQLHVGLVTSWLHHTGYVRISIPLNDGTNEWWHEVTPMNDFMLEHFAEWDVLVIHHYTADLGKHWYDFNYIYRYDNMLLSEAA